MRRMPLSKTKELSGIQCQQSGAWDTLTHIVPHVRSQGTGSSDLPYGSVTQPYYRTEKGPERWTDWSKLRINTIFWFAFIALSTKINELIHLAGGGAFLVSYCVIVWAECFCWEEKLLKESYHSPFMHLSQWEHIQSIQCNTFYGRILMQRINFPIEH